jgi:hypothetical protein
MGHHFNQSREPDPANNPYTFTEHGNLTYLIQGHGKLFWYLKPKPCTDNFIYMKEWPYQTTNSEAAFIMKLTYKE